MRALFLAAALLAAIATPAAAETWCLKSEVAGPGTPITYTYWRDYLRCSKENRLTVAKDAFGRDARMIEITVAKKNGE
jgi:hypothetical protein